MIQKKLLTSTRVDTEDIADIIGRLNSPGIATDMAITSSGNLVFSIAELRKMIFGFHYEVCCTCQPAWRNCSLTFFLPQATLLDIPQPEELPSGRTYNSGDLARDQDKYLGQLEPFLRFNGYKSANWGDWLEINALEVEESLLKLWKSKESTGPRHTDDCEWLIQIVAQSTFASARCGDRLNRVN